MILLFAAVPPSPPNFSPVKLEHAEQIELGYMPLRDDFERVCIYQSVLLLARKPYTHTHTHSQEYDNDAETLVSAMTITPDDDELDKALKLSHVDMYNKKIAEREKRKL